MGFRSMMVSEDVSGLLIPDWFLTKYPRLNYSWSQYQPTFAISTKKERKFYDAIADEELFIDIQKVFQENDYTGTSAVVLLHECGGITLINISAEKIEAREPTAWKPVEAVEHNYCNGCSQKEINPQP